MDPNAFRATIAADAPPREISAPLRALWWDAKGDWAKAHAEAQAAETRDGAAVHAYLHRVEGDLANARYWYNRAGATPETGTLADEWAALVRRFA